MKNNKHTGWIETYSGLQFDFLNPTFDSICIVDIAHHLSNTCRFSGATSQFYSVAQHSIIMANMAKKHRLDDKTILQCLLHDAAETYMGDLSTPLKGMFPMFKAIENGILKLIFEKYHVPYPLFPICKQFDTIMLVTERLHLMPDTKNDWGVDEQPIKSIKIPPMTPREAESKFLSMFWKHYSG